MLAHVVNPIVNVSNLVVSFAWFEKFGWREGFDRGSTPTFGSVCSGRVEIFLCQGALGSRGKIGLATTDSSTDQADKGVWMSVWVDDVDAVHRHCTEQGLEVTMPPTDEPWGVREMHVRHPDGHVFRVNKEIEHETRKP